MKIETVGYQEALRTATRQLMQEENLYISGLEKGVKPRNAKSERLLSLVPMFAKGDFFFRPEDINAQQEFLSYPKGKHDDIMDAVWTALDGHRSCRVKKYQENEENSNLIKKFLDWKLM
jgi:phage terminase large subunit-like protein